MKTHIVFVLDRSGSMGSVATDAAGGFNAFVEAQRKLPGKARLTLIQFDHEYQVMCKNAKLKDVPKLVAGENYIPRGSTALLDAVARAIAEHEGKERVIVAILTDGQENHSREITREALRQQIEAKQAAGWQFQYLSSDLDAFSDASAMGISRMHTQQVAKGAMGLRDAYATANFTSAEYRAGTKAVS